MVKLNADILCSLSQYVVCKIAKKLSNNVFSPLDFFILYEYGSRHIYYVLEGGENSEDFIRYYVC